MLKFISPIPVLSTNNVFYGLPSWLHSKDSACSAGVGDALVAQWLKKKNLPPNAGDIREVDSIPAVVVLTKQQH